MKQMLNIIFYALLLAVAMSYITKSHAADATHCVTTGARTACFITNTTTGVTTTVVTTRTPGVTQVRVTRGTYTATEITMSHGRATVVSGRDNLGNRWAATSVSAITTSGPSVATGITIADDLSIQN